MFSALYLENYFTAYKAQYKHFLGTSNCCLFRENVYKTIYTVHAVTWV